MKKVIVLLFLSALLLTSCAQKNTEKSVPSQTDGSQFTKQNDGESNPVSGEDPGIVLQKAIGGSDVSNEKYILSFAVYGDYDALIKDPKEREAFHNQFEHFGAGGTRDGFEFNIYTLLRENGIAKDDFLEVLNQRKERNGYFDYTDEEVELLYSDDVEAVYRHFANPCAVFIDVGEKVYPPAWLASHSAKEYREAGITSDLLYEKIPLIQDALTTISSSGEIFREIPDAIEREFAELQKLEGIPETEYKTVYNQKADELTEQFTTSSSTSQVSAEKIG